MILKTVRPYQTEAIDKMLELREQATFGVGLESPTGTGKCLGRGTLVMMADGSVKPVEQVKVDEEVMGPDSKPRRVISLSKGFSDSLYRIVPTKGTPYVVTHNHVLSLKMTGGSKHSTGIPDGTVKNISVEDYLATTKTFKHCAKGYRVGLDFAEQEVGLDPYFLGLWLGDGTSRTTAITSADKEVLLYLADYATSLGLMVSIAGKPDNEAYTMAIVGKEGWQNSGSRDGDNTLWLEMARLNLLSNKHIPEEYLFNSREIRLGVLAGVIDSDGSLTGNGYDVVLKNQQLADDVVYISRSLGLAAYVTECVKTCCNNGVKGTYHRISISGNTEEIPVLIERKKASPRRIKKDVLVYGITVEHAEPGEYYGFEVDGDHLFLLGDFTVTHNSIMMAMLAHRLASQGRSVLILAHRKELVEGNAYAVEQVTGERCYKELNTKYRTTEGDWNDLIKNGGITSASADTLQGRRLRSQPQGMYTDIICDEAHHVRPLTKKQLGLPCEDCNATGKNDEGEDCEACDGKGKIIETGSKYMKIKTHFKVPVWYGLSGTLYRKASGQDDKNIMTKVFDKVYSTGTLFEFIDKGWLVDMRIQHLSAVAVHLDFSRLAKKGMVTDKQAQEVWQTHKLEALSALRHGLAEWCKDRTTLIFSPKVQHAKWVTEFIQQADTNVYPNMGPETADYVASYSLGEDDQKLKYDDYRRTSVIERLRAGTLQWCANQGVFTEGTDIPTVAALAMCRVSQSINLVKQMIGRGARTLKGVLDGLEHATAEERKAAIKASAKPDCLVLDFVGAMTQGAGQFLANPTQIVEGDGWGEAQKKMAAEYWKVMWEKGKAPSVLEAKEEIEHATSEWMQGVRAMLMEAREKVTWEVTEIDPRGNNKAVATTHMEGPGGGASDKQVRYIVSLQNALKWQKSSHAELKAMTARQAGAEITELKKLRDELPLPKWMYSEFKKHGITSGFPLSWGAGQAKLDELNGKPKKVYNSDAKQMF